jgi:hypothetical protein
VSVHVDIMVVSPAGYASCAEATLTRRVVARVEKRIVLDFFVRCWNECGWTLWSIVLECLFQIDGSDDLVLVVMRDDGAWDVDFDLFVDDTAIAKESAELKRLLSQVLR